MKLGIGSWSFGWAVGVPGHPALVPLDAAALVRRAAAWGLRVVQIADNMPLHDLPGPALQALRRLAEDSGVTIEVGTRGLLDDHVASYLEVARALGATLLRIVVDRGEFKPAPGEIAATLRRLVPLLEAAGVTLAVENHDRLTSAELAAVVRGAGSPRVGICLDTVNSFGAMEGPELVVDTLGPLTVNLHLKDFTIRRAGHGMGFTVEGAPAGTGRLDVPWLLGRLRQLGRDPNAVIEQWVPPEATVEATVAKELDWARRSVDNLRPLIPG